MTPTRWDRRARELAYRLDAGVEVTLLWEPVGNELRVCVCDHPRGAYFELTPEPSRALDAFYHPYAYSSLTEVHYQDARLAA